MICYLILPPTFLNLELLYTQCVSNLGQSINAFRFHPAVEPLGYHCQALTGRGPEPSGLRNGSPRVFNLGRAAEDNQMPPF